MSSNKRLRVAQVPLTGTNVGAPHGGAPVSLDQEWANALTHFAGATAAVFFGWELSVAAIEISTAMAVACVVYSLAVFGTFLFSALSHTFLRQPWLNTFRAWDQAMIYLMIAGTYTPIAVAFAPSSIRVWLLTPLWMAAVIGFARKVFSRHRVNSISTVSYLLLGWVPALPLAMHVPSSLVVWMVVGGVLYTIGVIFLIYDSRVRYFHAAWHLAVVAAAASHFVGILWYAVTLNPVT